MQRPRGDHQDGLMNCQGIVWCHVKPEPRYFSGPSPPRGQLQPASADAALVLRGHGGQPLHPRMRVLGQLIQGLQRGHRQDCAGKY